MDSSTQELCHYLNPLVKNGYQPAATLYHHLVLIHFLVEKGQMQWDDLMDSENENYWEGGAPTVLKYYQDRFLMLLSRNELNFFHAPFQKIRYFLSTIPLATQLNHAQRNNHTMLLGNPQRFKEFLDQQDPLSADIIDIVNFTYQQTTKYYDHLPYLNLIHPLITDFIHNTPNPVATLLHSKKSGEFLKGTLIFMQSCRKKSSEAPFHHHFWWHTTPDGNPFYFKVLQGFYQKNLSPEDIAFEIHAWQLLEQTKDLVPADLTRILLQDYLKSFQPQQGHHPYRMAIWGNQGDAPIKKSALWVMERHIDEIQSDAWFLPYLNRLVGESPSALLNLLNYPRLSEAWLNDPHASPLEQSRRTWMILKGLVEETAKDTSAPKIPMANILTLLKPHISSMNEQQIETFSAWLCRNSATYHRQNPAVEALYQDIGPMLAQRLSHWTPEKLDHFLSRNVIDPLMPDKKLPYSSRQHHFFFSYFPIQPMIELHQQHQWWMQKNHSIELTDTFLHLAKFPHTLEAWKRLWSFEPSNQPKSQLFQNICHLHQHLSSEQSLTPAKPKPRL